MLRNSLAAHPAVRRVAWRTRRLQSMAPEEIVWRLRTRALLEILRRRGDWPRPRFVARPGRSPYRMPALGELGEHSSVIQQAECLLDGQLTALDQSFCLDNVDWHRDPQTGVTAPLSFGPLIDYRDPKTVGNVRNIWELSRHQYLTTAALAFALTRDDRFALFVRRQLESWLAQNPFALGANWASPLELGLRLISWVWIARFLECSPHGEALFGAGGLMWRAVYQHQWMIAQLRSTGSSANNHLIGEMAGLLISTLEWPVFPESPSWAQSAQASLRTESERQYYPSGVNREQAFGYQLFATELLILAGIEAQRAKRPFGPDYRTRLLRASDAALGQVGAGGILPRYGDADDGMAFGLPGGGDQVLGRIAIVASRWLRREGDPPRASLDQQLAARLLLSGLPSEGPDAALPDRPSPFGSRAFPDAGLFVMTSHEGDEEVFCLADAGELGYLSIAAHGHADALAFTLAVGDEQIVVDPGTYTYHLDPRARAYFRGTRAHNTITLDGQDQSVAAGPFLWTQRAQATMQEWRVHERGAVLKASHDGYRRLADPVIHHRTLALDGGVLTIDDELAGGDVHDVEWRLHLGPQCAARIQADECQISGGRHRLTLQLDKALRWDLLVGASQGGWYSCHFNQRQKSVTVVGSGRLALPVTLQHVLRVSR
jgi:hypothetical protein